MTISERNTVYKKYPGGGYYKDSYNNEFHKFDGFKIDKGSYAFRITFPNFDVNEPDRHNGFEIIHLELNIECKNADDPTKQRNIYIVQKYKYSRAIKHLNPGTIGQLHLYDVL